MNEILQRELDALAPAHEAWERRERALEFVRIADAENLNVAMWEWRAAQSEFTDARIAYARVANGAGAQTDGRVPAPKYSDFDRALMALALGALA